MTELRRALALLVAGAAVATLFLVRFSPARLLFAEIAPAAMVALAVLLACYAVGVLACRLAGVVGLRLDEALLIGSPAFGTLVAIVAWVGVALDAVVILVTMVAAVAGAILLLRDRPTEFPRVPALLWIPIGFALVEALLPVSSPDELIYKLGIPHTYRMFGRMLELPLHSQSYLTLAPHFTDLAALITYGGVAAKLARFGIYLAALAALVRLGRRVAGEGGAWIAGVFAWTPVLLIVAGWCWDEWIVIGLLAVSIDHWLDSRSPLTFIALGAAIACKYTALPWLAVFAWIVLWRDRRLALRGALIVIAFGGFFYLRNAVWTGSPVAPMLTADAPRVLDYRGSAWDSLIHGKDIFDPELADESLGILLPVAVLMSLFAWRDPALRDLLLLGVAQLPLLVAGAPSSRNLVGTLLPLAVAGGKVAIDAWRGSGKGIRIAIGVLVAVSLAAQLILSLRVLEIFQPVTYLAALKSPEQYVADVCEFEKPYAFIESGTPPSARVLLLGETQVFYLDREVIAGGNLDGPRIAAWLGRFRTPAEMHAEWQRMGISHVLMRKSRVFVGEEQRGTLVEREVQLILPKATHQIVVETLKTHAVLLYRDEDYLVFELR